MIPHYAMQTESDMASASQSSSNSPSPSLLATPVSSIFSSSRSVSGTSTISSQSTSSNPPVTTRSVSGSGSRRRGYVRPQGACFSPSAQNRDSVLSLGSIAHLQYYFARTGLLEGKGGQLAKKKQNGEYDIPRLSLRESQTESPTDEEVQMMWEAAQEDGDEVMLPPTVSTYSHRPNYVPPPPDHETLKRELVEALENALQALESCESPPGEPRQTPNEGFYQIQGLHILDTVTLAIRAARLYYTQHPSPRRLHSIRPDQQLRKELHEVLDILRKCASRNFAGGLREDERLMVLVWVSDVGMMIDREAKLQEQERNERKDWQWMDDSRWVGNEHARDISFLHFLIRKAKAGAQKHEIPQGLQFLKTLADGRDLIAMHNAAVRESKRHFELISSFHSDVGKPYRRADNLRYFIKAAERRFEIKVKFDVMAVANLREEEAAWRGFENALLDWSKGVRAELTRDWNGDEERRLHARAKSLALASSHASPSRKSKAASESSPVRFNVSVTEEMPMF